MFKFLKEKLSKFKKRAEEGGVFTESVLGKKISEKELENILEELKIDLLEADVAFDVAEEIVSRIEEELRGKKIKRGVDLYSVVLDSLKKAIKDVVSVDSFDFLEFIKNSEKPVVILFLGINGTGKTTTIAKIAHLLQKNGYSVVIAASDTFRAGAIEQLEIHAKNLGVKLIKHKQGSDPAAVAYDAVAHAQARKKDVVLIDTAGRMQTNRNLMDEMRKIKRVVKPHLTIFVGDSLAGNDAVEQAITFEKEVGFDAIILCKIDADAKGGAAISISYMVKKPIIYVGTGQKYDDLEKFSPEWLVQHIFS